MMDRLHRRHVLAGPLRAFLKVVVLWVLALVALTLLGVAAGRTLLSC